MESCLTELSILGFITKMALKELRDKSWKLSNTFIQKVAAKSNEGVVHRDLKPENLILSDDRDDALVKLADFGLSTIISNHDTLMKTSCGTLAYAAPEILNGLKYGQCVDFWSIGVIFYNLLSGYPPFFDVDERKMRVKIKEAQYKFYSPDWDDVSNEAKALIRGLIEVDPAKRLTASKALTHKWFDKTEEMKNLAPIVSDNLVKHFNAKRKLKVGANAVHFVVKEMNLHSKKSQKMLENLPQPEQYSAII